jgi:hypothetical protein
VFLIDFKISVSRVYVEFRIWKTTPTTSQDF